MQFDVNMDFIGFKYISFGRLNPENTIKIDVNLNSIIQKSHQSNEEYIRNIVKESMFFRFRIGNVDEKTEFKKMYFVQKY